MNKFFLALVFIFCSLQVFSQNVTKAEITYLNMNQQITTKEKAVYLVSNKKLSDDTFLYKKYSQLQTGKPVLIEKYFYDEKGHKKGKYISKTIDGYNSKTGFYIDNLKHGKWKEFNKIPQNETDSLRNDVFLKRVVSYNHGKREGVFYFKKTEISFNVFSTALLNLCGV